MPPQWEPIGALGRGITGTVLLARDRATGQLRAIKHVDTGVDDRTIDGSPPAELLALARIRHRNVVPVLEVVPDDTGVWVAMAYVEGATLAQLLASHGRLSPEQAVGVLDGALTGLAEVHRAGFVHGDVSPTNILVDRAGTSYLTDLGQAGPAGQSAHGGTPGYMSPEAVQAGPLHPSADVYAAAQVLRQCLTGEPPPTDEVTAAQAQLAGPQRLDQVAPPLAAVLARALALDPQYRPADAATFRAQLAHAADQAFTHGWRTRASVAGLASALGVEGTAIGTAMSESAAGSASPGGAQLAARLPGPGPGDSTTSAGSTRPGGPVAKVTGVVTTHKVATVVIAGIVTAMAVGAGIGVTVSRSPGSSASAPPTAPSAPVTATSTTTTAPSSTQSRPRTWTAQPGITVPSTDTANLYDASCPSSRSCLVVGGISSVEVPTTSSPSAVVYRMGANGTGLSSVTPPAGLGTSELDGIACPTAKACWAVGGGAVLHSTDDGTTWTKEPAPVGTGQMPAITCPTTSTCVIASTATATVVRTTNGGATWSSIGTLPATLVQEQITCPGTQRCWAVLAAGGTSPGALWTSTNGGATWSAVKLPGSPYQVFSVACPTPTSCAVAADVANAQGQVTVPEVLTTSNRGSQWQAHPLPAQPVQPGITYPATGPLSSVGPMTIGCSSPTVCVVLLGNDSAVASVMDHSYSTQDGWATVATDTYPSAITGDNVPTLACSPNGACLGPVTDDVPPPGRSWPILASPSP